MRPLRWKSRYLTGISETDVRISALVGMLNATAGEANRVEHCQDLNDFFEQLTRLTEGILIQLGESPGDVVKALEIFETELDAMLESGLPLAARGTPACNDCCMRNQQKQTHMAASGSQRDKNISMGITQRYISPKIRF